MTDEWLDKAMELSIECESRWLVFCKAADDSEEETRAEVDYTMARADLRAHLSLRAVPQGDGAEPVAWLLRVNGQIARPFPTTKEALAWAEMRRDVGQFCRSDVFTVDPLYATPPDREAPKDAQRYRWIRAIGLGDNDAALEALAAANSDPKSTDEFDAAVDTAMAAINALEAKK